MRATRIPFLVIVAAVLAAQGVASGQTPLGTAFTYQGQLREHGHPANGEYDFRFVLYDADVGGSQVGPIVFSDDVTVSRGLFTVVLDFGSEAFAGEGRWLEVAVRPGDSTGEYTVLSPRQEVTPTPYAIHAATAAAVPGVIRGEGTPGYIPMFTDTQEIGDSLICQSDAGNIGINTVEPAEQLDVNGTVAATAINLNGDTITEWPGIPTGVIVMWSGALADIPEGWALCDGTNGTPELTARFIRSVPDASTDPGSTGGSSTHSHGPGSYSAASHTHSYSGTTSTVQWWVRREGDQWDSGSTGTHNHTYSGTTDSGGGGSITGQSAEASSLPPYYELAFIMKLPEGGRSR